MHSDGKNMTTTAYPKNRLNQNPVSGIRVLGSDFPWTLAQVLEAGFRIPDSGFWVLMSLHARGFMRAAGVWIPDSGFWILGSDVPPCTRVHEGCWGLDSGFRILDSGF
jgi:hypothetical protein